MTFRDFLQKCIDALEKFPDHNILAGMGELLDAKQKSWAKANLRNHIPVEVKIGKREMKKRVAKRPARGFE